MSGESHPTSVFLGKLETVRVALLIVGVLIGIGHAYAQDFLQHVKGKVVDAASGVPVSELNVKLEGDETFAGQTDANGIFDIQVLVGRYKISFSHTGYETRVMELLVIAGKESVINLNLRSSVRELQAVEITSASSDVETPGQRSLTIEKTLRIPANFFDPVRVATAYPGVVAANDQGNSIIVRGNSPNGLLWRLNGLNIVNPNHLSNAGTFSDKPMANGGGTNILSAQMLGKTDFYTGAIPVSQGNTLSGVIDMELRDGNKTKKEYTAQASLIGLDIAAEGPLGKNQQTSFLANYRYSTVGLLSQMGIDFGGESIAFQDLSFHLNTVGKNGGELSFFGFGGMSKNEFDSPAVAEWEEDKDRFNIDYESATYAVGLNYKQSLGKGKLFVAFGYSSSDQQRNSSPSMENDPTVAFWMYNDYQLINSAFSSQVKYEMPFSKSLSWEIGVMTDYLSNEITSKEEYGCLSCSFRTTRDLDEKTEGVLLQPFTSLDITLGSLISAKAGIRYVSFSYNNSTSIEPRIQFDINTSSRSSLQLSYSLTSQTQLPQVYAAVGNHDLGLTKSHHFDMGFNKRFSNDLQIQSTVFFQHLFDVPVESVASNFSVINLLEGFAPAMLVNAGGGDNYGVDMTVEKQFFRKNYFLIGGSYYESKYAGSNGIWRDSRFNGNYTASVIHGKEWSKPEKRRAIGLNTRILYLGGLRHAPVDVPGSLDASETVYNSGEGFSEQFKDYFRIDLRLSFRKNKPNYTRTFAIDIQNLTSQQNEAFMYYDFHQNKVVTKYQLGIIPVLVYRIDF
jgi:hypothetical protein